MAFTKRGEALPLCEGPTPKHPHPRPLHTFAPFLEQVLTLREPAGHLQPFQPAGTPLTFLCFRRAMTETVASGTGHGNSGPQHQRDGIETQGAAARRDSVYC